MYKYLIKQEVSCKLPVHVLFTPFHARSIERAAEHEAKRTEQMAKGMLERQKLTNEKVSMLQSVCYRGTRS